MKYYINKSLDSSFEKVVEAVKQSLNEVGFSVLTEFDLHEKMKEKLDREFRKYKIIGACNPLFALQGIMLEDKIGAMLPCNVIIQEISESSIEVAATDPVASMQSVDNIELVKVAYEIKEKLIHVVESLEI